MLVASWSAALRPLRRSTRTSTFGVSAQRRLRCSPCDNRAMSARRFFGRAALLRCPLCGQPRIFDRWLTIAAECPGCAHRYQREEGYWLGAIAINTVATVLVFAALLVAGAVITWPDVPWIGLTVASVIVNAIFPIAFYPWSKTLWVAVESSLRAEGDRGHKRQTSG